MQTSGAYIQNTLRAPVAANAQTYAGERPFGDYAFNPVLATDLRQFGLFKTQLDVDAQVQAGSWDPEQPRAAAFSSVYLYHEFGDDRAEMKIGYLTVDFQFIGLNVGGQVASGAQGVYAVLPYEVGISHGAVEAPAFTLKYRWDSGFYVKGAAQRAVEPGPEEASLARDAVGLRFAPSGDKLLLVGEAGLKRAATAKTLGAWYRAGYITNSTPYTSLHTGLKKSGNYCAYMLADLQAWRTDEASPQRGIFVGGSAMVVPADLDVYRLYYEARIYDVTPFQRRPGDFASVVASYTAISQDQIHALAAANKTYWRASDSVTGSYTLHLARGTYMGLGLSYVNGPSVTPKTPSALTFTAQTSVFF
jgi:porin